MSNSKSQGRLPWYRWRFSVPMLLFVVLFGWLAWDSLFDSDFSLGIRVFGMLVCFVLASTFAWLQ